MASRQRQRWLEALDRRFFRERYDVQRLLHHVIEEVRRAGSVEQAAGLVVEQIGRALHPRFATLLSRPDGGDTYRAVATAPPSTGPGQLPGGRTRSWRSARGSPRSRTRKRTSNCSGRSRRAWPFWGGAIVPPRGRSRSFLLASLKHFLANERDRDGAVKRGGRTTVVPIEIETAEGRYSREPADRETPETIYERRWALALLERALERLRSESDAAGRQALFARLEGHLTGDQEALPYADLCGELGMSEGAIKVAVHRLRRRFGALLRDEVSQTVSDPADVDEEIRGLFRALRRWIPRGAPRVVDGRSGSSGDFYVVSDYVKGRRLDRYCDALQLPPAERARLFAQVCETIADAHRHGLCHGRLRPDMAVAAGPGDGVRPWVLGFSVTPGWTPTVADDIAGLRAIARAMGWAGAAGTAWADIDSLRNALRRDWR